MMFHDFPIRIYPHYVPNDVGKPIANFRKSPLHLQYSHYHPNISARAMAHRCDFCRAFWLLFAERLGNIAKRAIDCNKTCFLAPLSLGETWKMLRQNGENVEEIWGNSRKW